MGAFPSSFLTAPTSDPTVPLACAVLTFVYFNWQGARRHGVAGYLLTFAGSPEDFGAWILAILLFPVEVVSTTARILSLTVRLWANMFASDLIYLIFVGLLAGGASFGWGKSPVLGVVLAVFPATIPVLFIGLHVFVSVIRLRVYRSSRRLLGTGHGGRALADCRTGQQCLSVPWQISAGRASAPTQERHRLLERRESQGPGGLGS